MLVLDAWYVLRAEGMDLSTAIAVSLQEQVTACHLMATSVHSKVAGPLSSWSKILFYARQWFPVPVGPVKRTTVVSYHSASWQYLISLTPGSSGLPVTQNRKFY